MCLSKTKWIGLRKYRWDGDVIVHECIVPSSRPAVGAKGKEYDIDAREFLVTEHNEVIRRTLRRDIREYLRANPIGSFDTFQSREPGSFDARVDLIASFVADEIAYKSRPRDRLAIPDETLSLRHGDCEDRAFLTASLMLASGVSAFNIRVALGKVKETRGGRAVASRDGKGKDHVWVMYKTESGDWAVVEPIPTKNRLRAGARAAARAASAGPSALEYVPYFLVNDHHLWAVRHPENREASRIS